MSDQESNVKQEKKPSKPKRMGGRWSPDLATAKRAAFVLNTTEERIRNWLSPCDQEETDRKNCNPYYYFEAEVHYDIRLLMDLQDNNYDSELVQRTDPVFIALARKTLELLHCEEIPTDLDWRGIIKHRYMEDVFSDFQNIIVLPDEASVYWLSKAAVLEFLRLSPVERIVYGVNFRVFLAYRKRDRNDVQYPGYTCHYSVVPLEENDPFTPEQYRDLIIQNVEESVVDWKMYMEPTYFFEESVLDRKKHGLFTQRLNAIYQEYDEIASVTQKVYDKWLPDHEKQLRRILLDMFDFRISKGLTLDQLFTLTTVFGQWNEEAFLSMRPSPPKTPHPPKCEYVRKVWNKIIASQEPQECDLAWVYEVGQIDQVARLFNIKVHFDKKTTLSYGYGPDGERIPIVELLKFRERMLHLLPVWVNAVSGLVSIGWSGREFDPDIQFKQFAKGDPGPVPEDIKKLSEEMQVRRKQAAERRKVRRQRRRQHELDMRRHQSKLDREKALKAAQEKESNSP